MDAVILDIWKNLQAGNNLFIVVSALTAVLAFIAWKLSLFTPKKHQKLDDAVTDVKIDQVDGLHDSYERQLVSLTERVNVLSKKSDEMSNTIHKQQIRLTRLQVLVIQLKGLLVAKGVEIPPYISAEIAALVEEG